MSEASCTRGCDEPCASASSDGPRHGRAALDALPHAEHRVGGRTRQIPRRPNGLVEPGAAGRRSAVVQSERGRCRTGTEGGESHRRECSNRDSTKAQCTSHGAIVGREPARRNGLCPAARLTLVDTVLGDLTGEAARPRVPRQRISADGSRRKQVIRGVFPRRRETDGRRRALDLGHASRESSRRT